MTNYAMIVGYSKYQHFEPLPGIEATTELISAILSYKKDEYGVFDEISKPLLDKTPSEVETELNELCEKLQPEDRIALVLIGHGKVWGNENPELRIATHTADREGRVEANWLNVTSLIQKLDSAEVADRLVVLDCCGAGFVKLQNVWNRNVTPLDGTGNQEAMKLQIRSKHILDKLTGSNSNVACITTAAENSSAWLGRLPEVEPYPRIISHAIKSSPFLRDTSSEPTYFSQAIAICHYIASNADALKAMTEFTADELDLITNIYRTMKPDVDGRLWAADVTRAAAYLLAKLGGPQAPEFHSPSQPATSSMALLRISGTSRRRQLEDLKTRMDRYELVSARTRELIYRTLDQIVKNSKNRDGAPSISQIERVLCRVPEGQEYEIVEEVLTRGHSLEVKTEVAAARASIETDFQQQFDASREEVAGLKTSLRRRTSFLFLVSALLGATLLYAINLAKLVN